MIVFLGAVLSNAFELNTMIAKDALNDQERTGIITPLILETEKTSKDWAYTAAQELRKELKSYGIQAKVIVATPPGKKPFLAVEFASWNDYEQVKDLFYQDPPPPPNPSYMGVRVSIRVPRNAEDVKAGNVKIVCVDQDKAFRIIGTVNEKSAKLTPYYKDAWGEWVQGDPTTGAKAFEFTRYLRQNENNYSYAKFGEVYATAEYELSVPKSVLNREYAGYFKGYFKMTSEGYFLGNLDLNCNTMVGVQ